jgi:hypothetical protein
MIMDFKLMIGLGVAGNFTGHLEQAGEADDFTNVTVEDENAPKGLFPFYVPSQTGSFLEVYPISSNSITLLGGENLQIEPEVVLICSIEYEAGKVKELTPLKFAAYNDCSIRKEGATKISEKKNWGANSKGISDQLIDIDSFSPGGVMNSYRIVSFLVRDGDVHPYGVDSAVNGYSYFNQKLLDWIVEKMNTQEDNGPLESISTMLKQSHYPSHVLISIGATRYTEFGEKTFLQEGDDIFVVVYNSNKYTLDKIEEFCRSKEFPSGEISILHQRVVS